MPPALSEELKNDLTIQLRTGIGFRAIHEATGVSILAIRKIANNLKFFNHHTAPAELRRHTGRPRALNTAVEDVLRGFIYSKPWAYQEEMQNFLLDELDISMHQCVSRTLKHMGISLKSLRREAAERSQDLRDFYVMRLSEFSANQLIFVDESAANEHTAQRKRGWSELGIKPTVSLPLKRTKRWSMLPAYSLDGILTYELFHGSIDGPRFAMFLECKLLPQCAPFLRKHSVIIMDNCSTHHCQEIRDLCQSHGVKLLYLPPYSPDYNPIEELFSVIKA